MPVRRSWPLVLVVVWLAHGCGQSHSCEHSESGAAGCQPFSHLSDRDIDTYCEWQYGLHEDPGSRACEIDGSAYRVPLLSVEDCRWLSQMWRSWGCERTVAEQEQCIRAVLDDPCSYRAPVCQEISHCRPPPTPDAGG